MSMIQLTREGFWSIRSKSDPRFDCCGEGSVGGFVCPDWVEDLIREKEEELGCKRPDDLTYTYHKYRGEGMAKNKIDQGMQYIDWMLKVDLNEYFKGHYLPVVLKEAERFGVDTLAMRPWETDQPQPCFALDRALRPRGWALGYSYDREFTLWYETKRLVNDWVFTKRKWKNNGQDRTLRCRAGGLRACTGLREAGEHPPLHLRRDAREESVRQDRDVFVL